VGQVQAMLTALSRELGSSSGPSTTASLARIRATLRAALNAALRHGLIAVNPACRVELPPATRPRAVVWTANRIESGDLPACGRWWRSGPRVRPAKFLNAIRGHRLYAAYQLIALRGPRRGEAAGLRWSDVDLDTGVATISQQLQQYDGHMVVGPPKTPRSARTIALDRTTVAALRRHRRQQALERCRPVRALRTRGMCSPVCAATRWHRTGSPGPSASSPSAMRKRRRPIPTIVVVLAVVAAALAGWSGRSGSPVGIGDPPASPSMDVVTTAPEGAGGLEDHRTGKKRRQRTPA
jgi:integrase